MINGRVSEVKISLSCANIKNTFLKKITESKDHIFVEYKQYKVYDSLKTCILANNFLVHLDNAKDYGSKMSVNQPSLDTLNLAYS